MSLPRMLMIALAIASVPGSAGADPWKDESGQGRWRGAFDRHDDRGWDVRRDRKVKIRTADGCEIERKWKKGEYEEKVKCKPARPRYRY